jgi:integrase
LIDRSAIASAGIRKTPTGRYRVWWRLDDDSQGSQTFDTRDQARDFKNDLLAGVARDTWVDPRRGRQLFGDWARQWWDTWSSDPDRSPTTLEATEARFRLHVLPYFEQHQLRTVTVTAVRRWQNELKVTRHRGTVMACRSILYRILQATEDERLIVANPVRKVPAPKPEVDPDRVLGQTKRRSLTPEEAGHLLAQLPAPWWDHVIVLLGTGLRFGELGGLRRRRVHLDADPPVLQVVTTRYQAGKFGSGFKARPKSTAGIRAIPLAFQVAEAIRRQLPPGGAPDALIFGDPGADGARRPLSRYLFRHVYHGAASRLHDPARTLPPASRRVLATLRADGPQTLAQLSERFSVPGGRLRPATIQAALGTLEAASGLVASSATMWHPALTEGGWAWTGRGGWAPRGWCWWARPRRLGWSRRCSRRCWRAGAASRPAGGWARRSLAGGSARCAGFRRSPAAGRGAGARRRPRRGLHRAVGRVRRYGPTRAL